MWIACIVLTLLGAVAAANNGLPCKSHLRTILPELFTHCTTLSCNYSEWTSWKIVGKAKSANCSSGRVFESTRSRHDFNKVCSKETETSHTCKPCQYSYHVVEYIMCW